MGSNRKSTIQPLFCLLMLQEKHSKAEEIQIEVGLHQGSAISPLLFVIIIDVITEDIDEGTPWAMLFQKLTKALCRS